jgi:uncharacterized protein YlbG (UPF0298 family)
MDIMGSLEQKEIRPLEVVERAALYVYCHSYKGMRNLSRYGDVGFSSQKLNYSLLYVDKKNVPELLEQLNALKFVKKVRVSFMKDMNTNFSEAFALTNQEIKQELSCPELSI